MTETDTVTRAEETVAGYFAMWNEGDPEKRQAIIATTWAPDGSYVEPLMAAEGYDQLEAGVAGMQARFPGHTLRPAGAVETHHNRARWRWELVGPDGGEALAAGTNVAILAPDGRLQAVTGFFDHTAGIA